MPTDHCASDGDVVQIWQRLGSIYGHKWSSQYGEKVDSLWRKAMQSMPIDRLKVALARCARRKDAWPPSLPEFMELAEVTPDEVGAPDVDRAYAEACRNSYPYATWVRWSHRCVYWAAVRTGQSDIADRPDKMRKRFESEYQACIMEADALDEAPVGALPKRTNSERTAGQERAAAEALAEIRKTLAGDGDERG